MFYEPTTKEGIELSPANRSKEQQTQVDLQTARMALYHYESCFFSAKVRHALGILKLKIELRDILSNPEYGRDLLKKGGSVTVPCLYYEEGNGKPDEYLYESADIVQYLKDRFG